MRNFPHTVPFFVTEPRPLMCDFLFAGQSITNRINPQNGAFIDATLLQPWEPKAHGRVRPSSATTLTTKSSHAQKAARLISINPMKIKYRAPLIIAAISVVFFSTAGCTEKDKTAGMPAAPAPTSTTNVDAQNPSMATESTIPANPLPPITKWSDIKDDTFENRAHCLDGLKQLEARVDRQIAELNAKRAAMKGTTSTADWDFAMKEMLNSQAYLVSSGNELAKGGAEIWDQKKDTVGLAWVKTQDAYDKVKASTTN